MQRYIAFLRAINVGGHTVKMDHLRKHFEKSGFANVETFIASGNVIFESPIEDASKLERQIEFELEKLLGYAVATFIRTPRELANVLANNPFSINDLDAEGNSLYVAFLPAVPGAEALEGILASRTAEVEFYLKDREIFCLFRKNLGDSKFSGPRFEKTVGMPFTMRNITTVRKLAGKYPPPP
ncbi:MAG: DUF1697 domain-containing protein [Anaerolineae bacterium]|nr:DUF1697 domain-containing protein [Gemmatimonadaceae bacterium]